MTDKNGRGRHKETVPAFIDPIPFPDEIAHLAMIEDKLEAALEDANDSVDRIDRDYISTVLTKFGKERARHRRATEPFGTGEKMRRTL